MNENNNPINWSSDPTKDARPVPPPPPPPEITLRTMQSDIDSIKQSGGQGPVPTPFIPSEFKKDAPKIPAMPVSAMPDKSQDAFKTNGDVKLDNLSVGNDVTETINPEAVEAKSSALKKIILIFAVLIGVAGVAAAGYYYVYPKYFAANKTVDENIINQNIVPENNNSVVPEVSQTVIPEASINKSLFISGVAQTNIVLTALTADAIKQSLSFVTVGNGLVGISLENPTGDKPVFSQILPLFAGSLVSSSVAEYFDEDFTTFIYYDKNGSWPGFVAKLKQGAVVAGAQSFMVGIENSKDLANFYLSSPGIQSSGGFKTGAAGNYNTRYVPFAATGASLNYGFANDYLIISTSYQGFKAALSGLGL